VSNSPLDPLRSLFGERLDALAGGLVSGEVPITAEVANRLMARKLAASTGPVTSAEIEVLERNAFTVHIRTRAPIPVLRVDVHIDQQPVLPEQPRLGLRWTLRGLGPLAALATPFISSFKKLPPGIRLDGDRVWADIEDLLQQRGLADLLPLLTSLRVTTKENRFVVAFELRR
jgi:hypothetical protein